MYNYKYGLSEKVVSSNRSESINKKVIELKIVDEASSDTEKISKDSDLIIISTPLSSYAEVILKIKNSLKNGSILTDVSSVKENIIALIEKNLPENVVKKRYKKAAVIKKVRGECSTLEEILVWRIISTRPVTEIKEVSFKVTCHTLPKPGIAWRNTWGTNIL